MTLSQLRPRQRGRVTAIDLPGPLGRRLLELGLVPGAVVTGQRGVWGGGVVFTLRSCRLCLRRRDAGHILLEVLP